MSSLACKCVFYRTEQNAKGASHKLNFDNIKLQIRNITIDRAQGVNEKNGVICLIMFNPTVMAIKLPEMAHFLCFLLITVFFAHSVVILYISTKVYLYIFSKANYPYHFMKEFFRYTYIFYKNCG